MVAAVGVFTPFSQELRGASDSRGLRVVRLNEDGSPYTDGAWDEEGHVAFPQLDDDGRFRCDGDTDAVKAIIAPDGSRTDVVWRCDYRAGFHDAIDRDAGSSALRVTS